MRTAFRSDQLADPHMKEAEKALRTCVHCGFCTATCPTYLVLGDERDSPRGRIMLMQNMLEKGGAPTRETVTHLDRCLSCLGCRTACPSGVDYSALIDQSRIHIAKNYKRPIPERLFRMFVLFVLMRPMLFSLASAAARIFGPVLPGKLGAMARKVPRVRRPPPEPLTRLDLPTRGGCGRCAACPIAFRLRAERARAANRRSGETRVRAARV